MRKNNRKGFTIVELVIVIAVIAILAGVLIPTFSGIIKKAQLSAAAQEATNAYKEAYGLALADDGIIYTPASGEGENAVPENKNEEVESINNFKFTFKTTTNGAISSVDITLETGNKYSGKYEFTWANGTITAKEVTAAG
jgi:type IV pilus assembly protein PilA